MDMQVKLTQFSHGGGCGCKIAPGVLERILAKTAPGLVPKELLVGIETSDDAAVYQINERQAIVATTDFFMPIVDDPFDFGAIAATNAISDVYAMGGQPLFALALAATLCQAARGGLGARFGPDVDPRLRPALVLLTSFLHLMQPVARLVGRLRSGLTPWRQRAEGFDWPWPRRLALWTERARPLERWLEDVEANLRTQGTPVTRGGDFDGWDLRVRAGPFGSARLLFGLEEHGRGHQLARFRVWPCCSRKGLVLVAASAVIGGGAALAEVWSVAALGSGVAVLLLLRIALECGAAVRALLAAVGEPEGSVRIPDAKAGS